MTCPTCNGRGATWEMVPIDPKRPADGHYYRAATCQDCKGVVEAALEAGAPKRGNARISNAARPTLDDLPFGRSTRGGGEG